MSLPDGKVEKNMQSRSHQSLKFTENHRVITKNTSFLDNNKEKKAKQITTATIIENPQTSSKIQGSQMGTWKKYAKQVTTTTKAHRKFQRHHQKFGLPRWERGEQWAKQIPTATKIHREPKKHHQKYEVPKWVRGEKWAKQITTASKIFSRITETSPKYELPWWECGEKWAKISKADHNNNYIRQKITKKIENGKTLGFQKSKM